MKSFITINGRRVGPEYPIYIVAEMSANHNKDFEQASNLVRKAKEAGADCVKLQTYKPDTITMNSSKEHFRIRNGTPWDGRTLYDLYKEAYMPWEWQPRLKSIAENLGMDLFSTAFDPSAVDFLERMNIHVHKVSSFEVVDLPLIEKMSRTGKPLIMSTGMTTLEEIEEAIQAARKAGATEIALLKCTSAYPAPLEELNLRAIPYLSEVFHVPVGVSDHSLSITAPVAAVALGACIVEKHLTLSRDMPGPDSAFSLDPAEFKAMVGMIRQTEKALGSTDYEIGVHESKSRIFRRSLFVVKDVKAGEIFTAENVRSIRPGNGLHPRYLSKILGRRAKRDIEPGTPLAWELVTEAH